MFRKVCKECNKPFNLEQAKVDPHWNSYSTTVAYCYCPNCGCVLSGISPDAVDLAKNFKLPKVAAFIGVWVICGLAAATETLQYVAPIILFVFGFWLRTSALRDHRVIGWVAMVFAVIILGVVLYVA